MHTENDDTKFTFIDHHSGIASPKNNVNSSLQGWNINNKIALNSDLGVNSALINSQGDSHFLIQENKIK